MTEKRRKETVLKLRALLDRGTPRKMAILKIRTALQREGLPCSQASIYAWCKQHKVSTK